MATAKERHPEVYVERNEDTRRRQRTVPMEVFSFGASRTGTMSMKAAFEVLGFPTWHWVTMAENPPDLVGTLAIYEMLVQPYTRNDAYTFVGYVDGSTRGKVGT